MALERSLTVWFQDADATSLPSGENAIPRTLLEWPMSVRSSTPVAESQSLAALSPDADAPSLLCGAAVDDY